MKRSSTRVIAKKKKKKITKKGTISFLFICIYIFHEICWFWTRLERVSFKLSDEVKNWEKKSWTRAKLKNFTVNKGQTKESYKAKTTLRVKENVSTFSVEKKSCNKWCGYNICVYVYEKC